MNALLHGMTELANLVGEAKVPKPDDGVTPPGLEKFTLVMGWAKWISLGVLVMALMFAGVKMAIGNQRGDGGEHASSIGWVLGGVIVVSAAVTIVSALS
ncbi:MAG: hypothetical protein ACRC0L_08410 [Angustibacter sp.]